MFFQLLLLGGYAYAHFLQRFAPCRQVMMHCSLLGAVILVGIALFFVWGNPILPSADWRPENNLWPAWSVFRLLLVSIGAAYFLLAANTSLLQAWMHKADSSKSPYVLYIVSNTASLLALLGYPFLAEPFFALKTQAFLWSLGFIVYALLCALAARHVRDISASAVNQDAALGSSSPGWRRYLAWISLSACGVLVLMAITNQMTQDVPPVPFLWVLPLALYLLSYIVGFMDRLAIGKWNDVYLYILVVGCYLAWYLMEKGSVIGLIPQIAGYGLVLFSLCLFCHNGLYRRRPEPRFLTGFYLSISLGGVLGGIFVAIVSPVVFSHYWEYQISLVLAAVLAVFTVYADKKSMFHVVRHALWIPVLLLGFNVSRDAVEESGKSVYISRNFFGKVYVAKKAQMDNTVMSYELKHGHITHGLQIDHPIYRKYPTTYYTEKGGGGLAIVKHPKRRLGQPMHVGLLGMGIGTLAAHGQEGDVFRFYEINPEVINLATNSPWFTYVGDSKANVEVVCGDGRMAMEDDLKAGISKFDVLAIDVFSGDQVPVHIITKEAFGLYLELLEEDGLIAIHISNRYLDLAPVLKAAAGHYGLYSSLITTPKKGFSSQTTWVLMGRSERLVEKISPSGIGGEVSRLWTDDFSNLFSVLRK
ncbi:polyamine aminopropyltransferase [Pontiella desulfatans]|uniref:hypothetical protein n=1 Tax=Pontiella desulfatans TaxID=2750659 RepID=UPI001443D6E0|nr:hypothetical protein [Pontiella desulfatans]